MPSKDRKNKKRMPIGRPFKPGQSGCASGRRGNRVPQSSSYDEMVLRAGDHRVDLPDGTTASLIELSLLQDAKKAAEGKNSGSATRIQRAYALASSKAEDETAFIALRKSQLQEEVDYAEANHLPPPDILPHPAHVKITGRQVEIVGPKTEAERRDWEVAKANMRWLNDSLSLLKRVQKQNPEADLSASISALCADIERNRRRIPRGWNWKERIYTLDSSPEERDRTIASHLMKLQRSGETFDIECSALGRLIKKQRERDGRPVDLRKWQKDFCSRVAGPPASAIEAGPDLMRRDGLKFTLQP